MQKNNSIKLLAATMIFLSMTSVALAENESLELTGTESIQLSQEVPNPFIPKLPFKEELSSSVPSQTQRQPQNLPFFRNSEAQRPTTPEVTTEPEPEQIKPTAAPVVKITGLVWNTDRPQAIIEGQVVDIGDTVAEMKIVSIQKTGIDVVYQGTNFTIQP